MSAENEFFVRGFLGFFAVCHAYRALKFAIYVKFHGIAEKFGFFLTLNALYDKFRGEASARNIKADSVKYRNVGKLTYLSVRISLRPRQIVYGVSPSLLVRSYFSKKRLRPYAFRYLVKIGKSRDGFSFAVGSKPVDIRTVAAFEFVNYFYQLSAVKRKIQTFQINKATLGFVNYFYRRAVRR